MRDIVNSTDFSASNPQTKSKVVKMPSNSNSSGTLTRGDYRSYRDFLESYGDNKNSNDDQESVSSTDSGISSYKLSASKSNNTSTSSLNSEINGTSSKNLPKTEQNTSIASRTGSFRNYMDNYNNKKFGSVKPVVAPKQNIIKSEIVIQVNDPSEQQRNLRKNEPIVFVTTINGDEQGEDSIHTILPPPNFLPPPPPVPQQPNGHQNENGYIPPPPPFQVLKSCKQGGATYVFPSTLHQQSKNDHRAESALSPYLPQNSHHSEESFIPPPPPQFPKNSYEGEVFTTPPPPPELPDFKPHTENGEKKWATQDEGFIPPPPPPKLPDFKPHIEDGGKKWATVRVDGNRPNANPNQLEKRTANHAAAANLAKILTQHLLPRRKALEALETESNVSEQVNKPINDSTPSQPINNLRNGQNVLMAPPSPKLPQNQNKPNVFVTPSSHKLPQEMQNENKPKQKPKSYVSVMPKMPHKGKNLTNPRALSPEDELQQKFLRISQKLPLSPPPNVENTFPKQSQKVTMEISPPKLPHTIPKQSQKISMEISAPKLPVTSSKIESYVVPKQAQKITTEMSQTAAPKATNGRHSPNDSVDFNTTTVVPINDATTKVSKNDPNVRKLVYNTYRGLLGAYNNKANDMIATLPRNMVREDQGISKQLESMALQGGLEKLNGRTNPKVEQE